MELKKTATFETPAIYVNCYGERNAVGKLAEFWDSHAAQGSCDFVNDVAIEMLMNRIEGFAIARDPAGKPAVGALNELLKGANLLIDGGKFSLLAFFWNPDFCAKRLGLDDAKKAKMMDALKSIYYPDEDFDWREI